MHPMMLAAEVAKHHSGGSNHIGLAVVALALWFLWLSRYRKYN